MNAPGSKPQPRVLENDPAGQASTNKVKCLRPLQ